MDKIDNDQVVADWTDQPASVRLALCTLFLHTHGFLSDAEYQQVRTRIETWLTHQSSAGAHSS
jgi:hypothetical protein